MENTNIKPKTGTECLLSSFVNFYKMHGVNLEEYLVYFMGDGFNILLDATESSDGESLLLRSFVHESLFTFCNSLGVDFYAQHCCDSKMFEQELKDKIKSNGIIVRVNAAGLDYNNVFANSVNVPHYIYIMDYDVNKRECQICDSYIATVPPTSHMGWYSYDKLADGMKTYKFEYYCIQKSTVKVLDEFLSHNNEYYIRQKIKEGILRYFQSCVDDNKYWGYLACEQLVNKLDQVLLYRKTNNQSVLFDLSKNIRIWGYLSSQMLLLQAIQNTFCKNRELLCRNIQCLIDSTNSICFQLIKVGISNKENNIEVLRNSLIQHVMKEKDIYEKVMKCV